MSADMGYTIGVCGATGAVGREIVRILDQRQFPIKKLKLFASERSQGIRISYKNEEIPVQEVCKDSFNGCDVALFSAGAKVSRHFALLAAQGGCVVIDNTSAFRMDPDVPLVVPEVNAIDIKEWRKRNIIANPNCSTIQLAVVLKPIQDAFGIQRVVVSTYQSVSGAGARGIEELNIQSMGVLNHEPVKVRHFARQIAFNCLPHIDSFTPDGYTREEHKLMAETRKIFHHPGLRITATTVRVPVFYSHAEAVNIETEHTATREQIRELLASSPGVSVVDEPGENRYPTPIDAAGTDDVFVGRIRVDLSVRAGVDMWVVADNIRKGAALNAIQIAEKLVTEYL